MTPSDQRLRTLFHGVTHQDAERLGSLYERHGVAPDEGVAALVREIQLDGANTLVSVLRGWKGVPYFELVGDVARKLKLKPDMARGEVPAEREILEAVLGRFFETVTDEQREEMLDEVGESSLATPLREGRWVPGSLEIMARDVGPKEVSKLLQAVIVRTLGYTLAREATKRFAGAAGLAIPLLNVAMVGWTVVDLAGPAFRKTVPTVVEVALLRLEFGRDGND